jgi:diacylglycerol O-acyltransferase-1
MIKHGMNKAFSGFIIFVVSAIGHEYVISCAVGATSYWIFFGMLAQFFVIGIEKRFFKVFNLQNSPFGNFSFWISFCILGQPTLIFSYYIDYQLTKNGITLGERVKNMMDIPSIAGVLAGNK